MIDDSKQKLVAEIAIENLGQKEATGHNDGAFVEMLQGWMDQGAGWMKGAPWCATFLSWCVFQAAKRSGQTYRLPKMASSTLLYSWFQRNGLLLPDPEAYCVGLLKGDGGSPGKTHHHTFIVEEVDGDFVKTIDGNWNNEVCRTRHKITDCDFGPIL